MDGVPDDLHRAALNLIENALAHTPSGTPVTVSVRSEDDSACLEVSDRGPGVPEELRDRVFERFSRGGGDTGGGTGSGLGLAIVRAVAEAHGGSVTLDDAEGGGARFVLRLPAATGAGDGSRAGGSMTDVEIDDALPWALSWTVQEPLERSSHALAARRPRVADRPGGRRGRPARGRRAWARSPPWSSCWTATRATARRWPSASRCPTCACPRRCPTAPSRCTA